MNGIRGAAKGKGHLFASEKRYSLTLPFLAGQEKTLTISLRNPQKSIPYRTKQKQIEGIEAKK
jgi:hypothetical protein